MKSKVICVIMGGGRGTRLHPLTKLRCKPAVPLAGKYRLVDIPISSCLNSSYNQIYVLTQFNTASLHRHIQESYKFDPFGGGFVDILSAEQTEEGENWYQGTADAVRQNLHHFNAEDEDYFLILSGDQLYNLDFYQVLEQHKRTGADVTIAAKAVPVSMAHALGVMRVDDDLAITEFVEKPKDPQVVDSLALSDKITSSLKSAGSGKMCLASMGIYVFNKRILYAALESQSSTDFGREIIPGMLGKVGMYAYAFEGYWEDIGTVRSFFDANLSLTDPLPPFNFFERSRIIYTHARYLPASKVNGCHVDHAIISGGCIIEDAVINRCVIGVRSVIGKNSKLENVIVMGGDYFEDPEDTQQNKDYDLPDIGIGDNCYIKDAIIDKNARIGNNVRLTPEGKPDLYESGDVVIRDGVAVVLKNGVVPDNTVF